MNIRLTSKTGRIYIYIHVYMHFSTYTSRGRDILILIWKYVCFTLYWRSLWKIKQVSIAVIFYSIF
jgi:hypothetical protein